MTKYVKAKPGPHNSVVYTDSYGNQWSYEGGSRTWRNNNPGDVVPGKISTRNNAIGKAGAFAVFPDYQTGHDALLDSLRNTFGNKDLPSLVHDFAPENENDTKKYTKFLQNKTGVKDNKKVKNFTKSEFEKLWRAIEKMEGWRPGRIHQINKKAKVLGVSYDEHGIINGYEIEGHGWVSKDEGITLAEQGKVDAIVAISSAGHPFLCGRPGHAIS